MPSIYHAACKYQSAADEVVPCSLTVSALVARIFTILFVPLPDWSDIARADV